MKMQRALSYLFSAAFVIAAASFIASAAAPAAVAQDLAARRAARMNAGINLAGWIGGTGDLSDQHVRTFITDRDLKLIHDLGFQSVRLPFNPMPFAQLPARSPQRAELLAALHRAVDMSLHAGLDVSICVFPADDYKQQLFNGDDGIEKFVRLWRDLADSFATSDPEHVFFEIMNEPEQPDASRWVGIEAQVADAIRKKAPGHTIIATGARYSGLEDLLRTEPLHGDNIVYAFHFYDPFYFTHQGATWTSGEVVDLRNVPYPADPADVARILPSINDDATRLHLFNYGEEHWDAASIAERMAFAADWGRRHHVPVICNEFGAYKATVDPAARARYLHDVRTGLEASHIPWAMWDYRTDFGVVERSGISIQPDDNIVNALGLKTGVPAVHLQSTEQGR